MRLLPFVAGCLLSASPLFAGPDTPLQAFVEEAVSRPPFEHAVWGVRIEDDRGTILADHNGALLMVPASTRKTFTAAVVAECEGFQATIPTIYGYRGTIRNGVLEGDVVVQGFGDPSISGRYEYEHDRLRRLRPLLESLRGKGIRRVTGGVVADVSSFDRQRIPGGWKNDNLGSSYATPVDALAYNENAAGVTVDARRCEGVLVAADPPHLPVRSTLRCGESGFPRVSSAPDNTILVEGVIGPDERRAVYGDLIGVSDPALDFAQAVHAMLADGGIAVTMPPRIQGVAGDPLQTLSVVQSPPMYLLLETVLKNSQNLYSEMLLKRLSLADDAPASYRESLALERRFLETEVGIAGGEFQFEDGSGLSPENLFTPAAGVKLMRYLESDERRGRLFRQLLASPKEDGTLRRRLGGLEDRLRAKTGSIDQVAALVGSIEGLDGRRRYFCIMVNHHTAGTGQAQLVIDAIIMKISEL